MQNEHSADRWPAAPPLPRPVIMDQYWADAVFLHWRVPALAVECFMPPGVVPDVHDGDSWVGLIGFRMLGAGIGTTGAVPYFGTFIEVNVRLYSRESDGTRGVVFLTLDASRLAVVLAARVVGIPYVWSRCRSITDGPGTVGYSVARFEGATTSFTVRPRLEQRAVDPLSTFVTARFGLPSRLAGRTQYIPNTHAPWPLHPAEALHVRDDLLRSAGVPVEGPPESVLYSPGVQTQFGKPRALRVAT